MPKKVDKWFEDEIQLVGMKLQSEHGAFFHRFPDAKAARGALPPQPGDFMLVNHPVTLLIEAKTSEKYESLSQCAASHIKPEQVGHHSLWCRSGNNSLFLFYSEPAGMLELWDGRYVADQRRAGKKLDRDRAMTLDYFREDMEELLYSMVIMGSWDSIFGENNHE